MTPKPDSCESCGFETPDLEWFSDPPPWTDEKGKWLCNLCSGTYAGNAAHHPEMYPGQVETLKSMAYIGNVILAAIKALGDRL